MKKYFLDKALLGSVILKVALIIGGAILIAILLNAKPAAAKELSVRISYEYMMLTPGETTQFQVLYLFETEKVGRRTYNLIVEGQALATVKFSKGGVLKSVTLCDEFLDGLLLKGNAPRFTDFVDDLTELGIVDCNSQFTGSRDHVSSEMSIKNGKAKYTWCYKLKESGQTLDAVVTGAYYHKDSLYVDVFY